MVEGRGTAGACTQERSHLRVPEGAGFCMADGKGPKEGEYVLLRPDRRKALRRHLLVLKVQDGAGNVFFGYAKNLSRGGMFVATVNPRGVGEEFSISFELAEEGIKVRCRCRVMWSRQFDPEHLDREPGMGLKFIDIDEDSAERIDAWVNRR